jgi:putative transposase
MGNHYHILVETPQANLVRGMTWFQTTYTVRYNTTHRTSGHLYGGRYKAVLVETSDGQSAGDPDYSSTLLDYIPGGDEEKRRGEMPDCVDRPRGVRSES